MIENLGYFEDVPEDICRRTGTVKYERIQANTIVVCDTAYFNCGEWRGSEGVMRWSKKKFSFEASGLRGKDVERGKGFHNGHINVGRNFFHERRQL